MSTWEPVSVVFLYANRGAANEMKGLWLKADRSSADPYSDMFCVCDHVVVCGRPGF